jgi:hypothetical protein
MIWELNTHSTHNIKSIDILKKYIHKKIINEFGNIIDATHIDYNTNRIFFIFKQIPIMNFTGTGDIHYELINHIPFDIVNYIKKYEKNRLPKSIKISLLTETTYNLY